MESTTELKIDLEKHLTASGRTFVQGLSMIPATARRVVSLDDDESIDIEAATAKAIEILSKNPKGYFLMAEWDLHPTKPERCLDTVVKLDKLVQKTTHEVTKDTLVMFTADTRLTIGSSRARRARTSSCRLPAMWAKTRRPLRRRMST